MSNPGTKHCVPCSGDTPPLMAGEIELLLREVPDWTWKAYRHIEREFRFKDFAEAIAFVNKVSAVAEAEGHHPDIELGWGYVRIKLITHAIDGLSENDFILAAKIDALC